MQLDWKIPNTWKWIILKDIGLIVSGGTPSTKESNYWGSDIRWISPSDLTGYNLKFISRGKKSISSEGLKKSSAKLMPPGSVHFSSRAPIGYVVISSESLSTNQGFKSIVPVNGIFNQYLYYYFKSIKQAAESVATGTTFKELSGAAFSKLEFPLCPFNEQHRIVSKIEELFSELDKGIESLKKAREQLKVYRQALLKHAFEGKLTEQWRKDNAEQLETADQLLEQIKQEREDHYQQHTNDWKEAVKQWEVNGKKNKKPAKPKKLKSIDLKKDDFNDLPKLNKNWVYCGLGSLIDEPKYGTSKKCGYDTGETGVLRIPNVKSNIVDDSDLKFADFDDSELSDYNLLDGDILIIRSNGSVSIVGKGALIEKKNAKFIFAGYLIRLRPNRNIIIPKLLILLLQSHLLRKQIEYKAKSTSGVNNINSGEIQSLIVPIMRKEEQKLIVDELDKQLSVIENNEIEINNNLIRSESLRQSILKKAFSGKLASQDPNDEPASELLKRIAQEKAELEAQEKAAKAAIKKSKPKTKKKKILSIGNSK